MTQATHLRLVLSPPEGGSENLANSFSQSTENLHIHLHLGTPLAPVISSRTASSEERLGRPGKGGAVRRAWLGLAIIAVAALFFRVGLTWGEGSSRFSPDAQAGVGSANAVVPGLQSVQPGPASGGGPLEALRQQLATPSVVTGPAASAASGPDPFGRQR